MDRAFAKETIIYYICIMENWKQIKGYEGIYEISDLGKVKSIKRNIILSPTQERGLYYYVILSKNGVQVTSKIHRLVATNFIDNPENKRVVNHINKIPTDNRVENLEWVNTRENVSHGRLHKKKTSKYIGVSYSNSRKKWCSVIYHNGKHINLGRFKLEDEAYKAYTDFINSNNIQNKYA